MNERSTVERGSASEISCIGFRIADCLPVKTRFGGLKTGEQRQMLCNAVLTEVGGAHQTFLRNPLTEIEK